MKAWLYGHHISMKMIEKANTIIGLVLGNLNSMKDIH